MDNNIDWSQSHNGVMLCSFEKTVELMPEVSPILDEVIPQLQYSKDYYLIDVKIHMLMPKQFPCIPNWHRDFVPRDENLKRDFKCDLGDDKMYMWVSGAPLTLYRNKDGSEYTKPPKVWNSFTRHDIHRGTASEIHTWRCFIRVIPAHFVHSTTINVGKLRRHTQIYLNAEKFNW